MKRCIFLILGWFLAVPALANVIYKWQAVTEAPEMPSFAAELHITDEAYRRGSAVIDFEGCGGMMCLAAPALADAGILYLGFTFALGSYDHWPPMQLGVYDRFDLAFDRAGGVSGKISFNSTQVELDMSGAGLWTVNLLRGDPYIGTPCGGPAFCAGATGYFKAEALPVPEPHALPLMLAGLAALVLAASRRLTLGRRPVLPVAR